ncbi:MAG TPA: ATP-binding protein [Pyrinomonadaceae bacterium]|jgi:serine/threonine-protein kinase RsbW|nr:ATP-binding protein [Pyrinomonadaceae bacterium]
MQRQILIVDDHDDLASDLRVAFDKFGYSVTTLETRNEALDFCDLNDFDVLIIDLDDVDENCQPVKRNGKSAPPEIIKAFKISAANFRRDDFNEEDLRQIVETTLDYKAKFIDDERVKNCREKIEFELPSAISTMHSILNYLLARVEKMGVIHPEKSNVFVALDEAFVNAVKHGNRFNHEKLVRITAEVSAKEARFTVEDEGEGFDVSSIPDPLDPANLFKTSGRGVFLMYNIMDEVRYNERGNRLELVKRSETELNGSKAETKV